MNERRTDGSPPDKRRRSSTGAPARATPTAPAPTSGRRRNGTRSSITAVTPTLRRPGVELGPRANRTIAGILDATRQLLLVRGYAGATVDEITRVAGVSRASFYTYFPSKRDVLLALGADSASEATDLIAALADTPPGWVLGDLESWVARYFALLDDQGSFAFAWTQAAHEDEEIRAAGMKRHLLMCRRLGQAVSALGGQNADNPTELGLLVFSMLERSWAYCQLYEGTLDPVVVHRTVARIMAAAAPRSRARAGG